MKKHINENAFTETPKMHLQKPKYVYISNVTSAKTNERIKNVKETSDKRNC